MFVCAGEIEQFGFARPIGIGLIESASTLTRLIVEHGPSEIVFVGTAGSYGEGDILDIVESYSASNIEHSLLMGTAYTPIDNHISYDNFQYQMRSISYPNPDVSRETIVNSSNYITTDSKIATKYMQMGIGYENMEFYSVLEVARVFDIPAKGILVVTNFCSAGAHQDFVTNHARAMEVLTNYIEERYV